VNKITIDIDEDIKALLPAYIQKRFRDINRMRKLTAESQWPAIADQAHTIKGSGQSYGLPALSEHCRLLQKAAADKNREKTLKILTEMEKYLKNIKIP